MWYTYHCDLCKITKRFIRESRLKLFQRWHDIRSDHMIVDIWGSQVRYPIWKRN